jgi:hypothetical protein
MQVTNGLLVDNPAQQYATSSKPAAAAPASPALQQQQQQQHTAQPAPQLDFNDYQ